MAIVHKMAQTKPKRKYVLYSEYEQQQSALRQYIDEGHDNLFSYTSSGFSNVEKHLPRYGVFVGIVFVCLAMAVGGLAHRTNQLTARLDLQEALYENCRAD